jgi:mannose/fructose/N-acetylgalactosamine-specific phosphotransferase system component IIC
MAEMVTIDGQQYVKREPLGVLGLTFITLGVYFFVWFFKINDELRRAEDDQGISPTRSLLAMTFGWLLIVPPFIAMYNSAKHVQALETRRGVIQTVEPALTVVLMLLLSFANGIYIQEHLNRAWGATAPARIPADPGLAPTVS